MMEPDREIMTQFDRTQSNVYITGIGYCRAYRHATSLKSLFLGDIVQG